MAERADITPEVLKWARETAKMSEIDAAAKVFVKAEKITEWENGQSQPSNSTKIKIPNVCDNMGVIWINDYAMVEELGLKFSCSK